MTSVLRLSVLAGLFFCLSATAAQAEQYQVLILPAANFQKGQPLDVNTVSAAAYPRIKPSNFSASHNFISKTSFYIVVVNNWTGQVVPNAYIWLTPRARANTGGHGHHDDSRPTGEYDRYEGGTGTSGWDFYVTYTAPELSGIVDTQVDCTSPYGYCYGGNLPITMELNGLVPLPNGLNYDLVGSYGMPGVNSRHVSNHNGISSFVSKLVYLADIYYLKYNAKLAYNDMSLPKGGLFDVYNNWSPAHWEHRNGTSVDMRLVPVARRARLKGYLKDAGITGTLKIHSNHWHVRN